MAKTLSIKLISINYAGDSVGEDVHAEINILGQVFKFARRIKRGDKLIVNQEAFRLDMPENVLEADIAVKVIEKDFIFSDSGQSVKKLSIQNASLPQEFSVEVKVQERRLTLRKSTAIFNVSFVIESSQSVPKVKPYNIGPQGENYNIYDKQIEEVVKYWNDEFSRQQDPPKQLLDPNLIKAMMYVESKIGYYRPKNYYSGYPDVMQVADPRNDAIYALKNIYNPNPGRKKVARESDVINRKLTTLKYPEANGDTPEQSIKWGVCWLYHLAQNNVHKNEGWVREWKDDWKEAAYLYNAGGDEEYLKKVYDIYERGMGDKSYKLWSIGLWMIGSIGVAYLSLYSGLTLYDRWTYKPVIETTLVAGATAERKATLGQNEIGDIWSATKEVSIERILDESGPIWQNEYEAKKIILESYSTEDLREIQDIKVTFYDQSIFLAIIEWEKDWWEELKVGRIENAKIIWLNIEEPPTEASILSVRFVKQKTNPNPILEVFGQTHMGNGHMYLYNITDQKLNMFFDTAAVDAHNENVWQPEGYSQYGYFSCGQVYKDGRLLAKYGDLNDDGFFDVELVGKSEVLCEKVESYQPFESYTVKVDEIPVRLTYLIKP